MNEIEFEIAMDILRNRLPGFAIPILPGKAGEEMEIATALRDLAEHDKKKLGRFYDILRDDLEAEGFRIGFEVDSIGMPEFETVGEFAELIVATSDPI